MAKPSDERPGSGREEPAVGEEERRAQGYAVAGIHALSANLGAGLRSDWGLAGHEDAMSALATAIDDGRLGVPRLLVLDALVKLAHRRPEELTREGAALDALLMALVRDAEVAPERHDWALATARRALDSVAQLSVVGSRQRPWPTFARVAGPALRLTPTEVDKPLCNDREIVVKGGREAVGVTVSFHTDAAPGEMDVCDPTSWHECTAAFHEMKPWTGAGAVDQDRPNGWRRDLIETVDFLPALTLETPLRFTYSIDDGADPRWVHLDYVLLEETADIAIDEGSIDVRRVTSGKHSGRTRVSTKKAIRFVNPVLAQWPTVACDTFWTDLVVNAAVGCLGGGGAQTQFTNGGKAAMTDPKADALNDAIKDAATAAQESIDAYAELAKQAAAQLSGDPPPDNAAWVQLTTKAFGQAATDAARTWSAYNEVLRILADPADPAPGNPADPTPDG